MRYEKRHIDIDEDFEPKKLVFAILLKNGEKLTADTLFPFAQVALLQAVSNLLALQIEVEVVSIPLAE